LDYERNKPRDGNEMEVNSNFGAGSNKDSYIGSYKKEKPIKAIKTLHKSMSGSVLWGLRKESMIDVKKNI
jgi:hypothetical protein